MKIRRLASRDAEALAAFYNGLSWHSRRTFRPLGWETTPDVCEGIVRDNHPERDRKFDLIAMIGGKIVGWGFLWHLDTSQPTLGLAVADAYQGMGLGNALMDRLMKEAHRRDLSRVFLTVVTDNERAWRLYERHGFVRIEAFRGDDGLPYYRMIAELGAEG